MKLSSTDLPWFFEPRHHALASRLLAVEDLAHESSPLRIHHALGHQGLYRELVPHHDSPIDVRGLCLVREALAYASPLADAIFAVQGLGAHPLWLAGSAPQRDLLGRVQTGEALFAFALTEPEAGSDVAAMRCSATPTNTGYVLEGEKTLISNAGIASHYVVFANANPNAGKKGIGAFLVPADTPRLEITPIALGIEHPMGKLRLAGVHLPSEALIGEVGGGLRLALGTLETFRVTVGASAVGMARRALDETLVHVRTRKQFGHSLSEEPLVRAMLADMATELDAARLLVLRAAMLKDQGQARLATEGAMAKLYATEAAQRIIDHAVQLHGGAGVTLGSIVERLYRAIRPLRIYEGTSEIQRLIIGRALAES